MRQDLRNRIRSTATKPWRFAKDAAVDEIRGKAESVRSSVGDALARAVPFIEKIAGILFLSTALLSFHYFGFLRELPASIQRLAATTFASEFSATFLYYALLAVLGARLGTYVTAAAVTACGSWRKRGEARRSDAHRVDYFKSAKQAYPLLEWPTFFIAPIVVILLYADAYVTAYALAGIAAIFLALLPIASPKAALEPVRHFRKLTLKRPSLKRLQKNVKLMMLSAVALVAFSYFLGKARYERLAKENPVLIQSTMFNREAVILAHTETSTLVLERSKTGTHRRFTFFREGFLATDTLPQNSVQFEEPPSGKKTCPVVNIVNFASPSEATSAAAACGGQGGR